jgi:cAMP-binding proteins - catabolite gene activator and regulatory subunit of cAMP-dependent protein kinases
VEWGTLKTSDYEIIGKCPLFENCGEATVRAFLEESGAKAASLAPGERIPEEVRRDSFGIVLSGRVKIYSEGGESTLLLNTAGEGAPFGISALAGCPGNPAASDILSSGRSRVALIGVTESARLIGDYPVVAANLLRFFCGRVSFLTARLRTLSRSTAESRLADYLLTECGGGEGATVRVKSCAELAVRLNLSRASLYRALDALEESGVITRDGKAITVPDPDALENV